MSQYQKTRKVMLDLLTVLDDRPTNEDVWKLHIDLACDKIERIYSKTPLPKRLNMYTEGFKDGFKKAKS